MYLNLYHWVHDHFTSKINTTLFQLLVQLLIKAIISNTYYIFTQPLSRVLDFGFNDFIGLKNTLVAVGPHDPMLSSGRNSPKRTQA